MAAAGGSRLAARGERLRRGFAAGRRAWPGPGPVAAAVAGVAVAGAGAAWYHGRVNVAAPQGSLTVLAQVRDGPSPAAPPRPSALGRPEGGDEQWASGVALGQPSTRGDVGACPVQASPSPRTARWSSCASSELFNNESVRPKSRSVHDSWFCGQLSGTLLHVINLCASRGSKYKAKDVSSKTAVFESKGHIPWFRINFPRKTFEALRVKFVCEYF